MPLSAGARLGPYEILAAIGADGMSEVYQARDTRLGRTVAVKVLSPGASVDRARRLRFEQEARAVSTLNHPHICVLHDIGREGLGGRLKSGHLWTGQTRPIRQAIETSEFYPTDSSVCKSVCTLVRQLRGPHFSTCA